MQLTAVPMSAAIPQDLAELWEERAAIMQYDGGLTRQAAEWQAFLCLCGEENSEGTAPSAAA